MQESYIDVIRDELNAHNIKFIKYNERPINLKASVNKTVAAPILKEKVSRFAFVVEFILDSEGRKMSKSKGNSVFALDLINQYGPDSSRLFFFNGPPWKPKPLSPKSSSGKP